VAVEQGADHARIEDAGVALVLRPGYEFRDEQWRELGVPARYVDDVRRNLEACAHDGVSSVNGEMQLNAAHASHYGKETRETQDLGCSRDHSQNISNPACIAVWRKGVECQIRKRESNEERVGACTFCTLSSLFTEVVDVACDRAGAAARMKRTEEDNAGLAKLSPRRSSDPAAMESLGYPAEVGMY
jgi:hypothetical protein